MTVTDPDTAVQPGAAVGAADRGCSRIWPGACARFARRSPLSAFWGVIAAADRRRWRSPRRCSRRYDPLQVELPGA